MDTLIRMCEDVYQSLCILHRKQYTNYLIKCLKCLGKRVIAGTKFD